ncbi:MAG TPA: aldo/keto reductase [bacterium]
MTRRLSRREFLRLGATAAAAALTMPVTRALAQIAPAGSAIPTRPLGSTGVSVTALGLGGEGVLRTWGRAREAERVIRHALAAGITYCDTAPAYSASQDYYGGVLAEYRSDIFLASKTHDRSRDGSLRLLDESLRRLRTDRLDLWQLHDLRSRDDLTEIFSPRGAIHAMEEARRDGRVRFLGITGHYDPAVLVAALREYRFDTVLAALNVADRARLSFIDTVLPAAAERQAGIIGMKVVGRGQLLDPKAGFTVRDALGYVLSLPVTTAIIGFSSTREVDEAVAVAAAAPSLGREAMAALERRAAPLAADITWYKRAS